MVTTHGIWFGPDDDASFGWLTRSDVGRRCGVVLVPPLGYEYMTSHRSLRALAERLAERGFAALRVDLHGTADAPGDQWGDVDMLPRWREDIARAVAELRRCGADSVAVVGLRFGATLGVIAAADVDVDAVVAWVPVTAGKRYARGLSVLSVPAPGADNRYGEGPARAFAGTIIADRLFAELASAMATEAACPAPTVLIVDRDDKPESAALLQRMRDVGADVSHALIGGADTMLDVPTEVAVVPEDHLDTIVHFLAPMAEAAAPATAFAQCRDRGTLFSGSTQIQESVVRLGERQLVGVQAAPIDAVDAPVTVVFLNTGSEPHIGSGRVWVEFSRALAAAGSTAIRLDFSGWGESPDDGFAPARPYDQHALDDVEEAVRALKDAGHQRIVLAGICAGAWIGLARAGVLPIDGFVAFNPQLYWQPGDPVEAVMSQTRVRRTDEIEEFARGAESGEWTRQELRGQAPPQAEWLTQLATLPYPVVFAFAPGDDGLEYLRTRLGHRLQTVLAQQNSSLTITELSNLDHPMHLHWYRAEGFAIIESMVAAVRRRVDQSTQTDTIRLRPPRLASYRA